LQLSSQIGAGVVVTVTTGAGVVVVVIVGLGVVGGGVLKANGGCRGSTGSG